MGNQTRATVNKAALLVFRMRDGVKQLMLVRDGSKPYYVMPGGKVDPGETVEDALRRELEEELGTKSKDARYIGKVIGNTPDGRTIEEHLYIGSLAGDPKPHSEIAEIVWMDRATMLRPREDITPLTREHILPFLDNHNLWEV